MELEEGLYGSSWQLQQLLCVLYALVFSCAVLCFMYSLSFYSCSSCIYKIARQLVSE